MKIVIFIFIYKCLGQLTHTSTSPWDQFHWSKALNNLVPYRRSTRWIPRWKPRNLLEVGRSNTDCISNMSTNSGVSLRYFWKSSLEHMEVMWSWLSPQRHYPKWLSVTSGACRAHLTWKASTLHLYKYQRVNPKRGTFFLANLPHFPLLHILTCSSEGNLKKILKPLPTVHGTNFFLFFLITNGRRIQVS